MENLFNSPVLIKIQGFGQKLGTNKFVSALQAGMMGCVSIIMTGSVFQIICSIMTIINSDLASSTIYTIIYMPYNFSMNLIGLWVVALIGYNYAKNVGVKSPLLTTVECLMTFTLIACFDITQGSSISSVSITYLGSQGMFLGFVVCFIVVQIDWFCEKNHVQIKMPDVCPPSLVNSMAAIIPSTLNVAWALILSAIVNMATGGTYTLASGFMTIMSYPIQGLTSTPGMFVLALFATVMWCFGIHGTMLIISVLMAPMVEVAALNAATWEAGVQAGLTWAEREASLTFYPVALFGAMAICGGTGNTLPLCLMGLKSKSKQISAVSKVGLVPGWFGINEPVTFGMPIMYNPILCIPYILNVQLVTLCTYIAYKVGFLVPAHVYIGSLMPMGFAQFLGTFNWRNAIWDYICIIPAGLVWYPFFKVYEKQLIAQEAAAEAEMAEAQA